MPGPIDGLAPWGAAAVTLVSAIAALTDLRDGRVYNWLTAPAAVLGIAAAAWFHGWTGLAQAGAGLGLGLALFGWIFGLGFLAGGDVKLLMCLGAWGGYRFVTDLAMLSLCLGGLASLGFLVWTGRFAGFAAKVRRLVLSLAVPELEVELPRIDRSLTLPFAVPMAAAAIWLAWADPLARWGLSVWS